MEDKLAANLKDRFAKWEELRELYVKAEELQEQGVKEITIPVDLLLVARDIPRSLEKFYMSLFWRATEPRPN